jgi:hypothetical protein
VEEKKLELWALRGKYNILLMGDIYAPDWDSQCSTLEQQVVEMEREYEALKAAAAGRPPTPRPAEPAVLEGSEC